MRTAIYGAGSLGTVLGAYLTRAGIECDLISRNKAHITALQQKGAHIVGKVDLTVGVSALLPEQMQGTYDLIILLTKQLENRKVATFLRSYLAKDGLLVTMQNGLPESELAQVLGAQRVAGSQSVGGPPCKQAALPNSPVNPRPSPSAWGCSLLEGRSDFKLSLQCSASWGR